MHARGRDQARDNPDREATGHVDQEDAEWKGRAEANLNQVVRETLALRSYEQRISNINILEALASGLPEVFSDPHQIQQVLLNLIINAEQAMLSAHGRGTLIVRTWHDADRDALILEVNDDGPGVPEEVQPRIFDPFLTTK